MADELTVVVAIDRSARQVDEHLLRLPAGSRVADALQAAGCTPELDVGIWGRKRAADTLLAPGDRVEVYRALRVDPKTARRERFREQGARGTGLFARKPVE